MSNITYDHTDETAFFNFIIERHSIYVKRFVKKLPPPWTEDKILRTYRFTNVFRELDKGTIALREMCEGHHEDIEGLIFNIMWYRMFNWWEHAKNIGWCHSWQELSERMKIQERNGRKLFTSAHMTVGRPFEAKIDTMLSSLKQIYNDIDLIKCECTSCELRTVFNYIQRFMGIGKFIAYEIVTDFRHRLPLSWTDFNTWANVGPGAKRGLQRMGMSPILQNMIYLLNISPDYITRTVVDCGILFELREIEHCLCEFDKYQRVKLGEGKPRERFKNGN